MIERIIAIDPGPKMSAYVVYDTDPLFRSPIQEFGKIDNNTLRSMIKNRVIDSDVIVLEMIASYGMAVGAEVFETCVWIGRFQELARELSVPSARVYRKQVTQHLCNSNKASDANIRAALIDKFGGQSSVKKANKCSKRKHETCGCGGTGRFGVDGVLVGVSGDVWQAIGVAVTYVETMGGK